MNQDPGHQPQNGQSISIFHSILFWACGHLFDPYPPYPSGASFTATTCLVALEGSACGPTGQASGHLDLPPPGCQWQIKAYSICGDSLSKKCARILVVTVTQWWDRPMFTVYFDVSGNSKGFESEESQESPCGAKHTSVPCIIFGNPSRLAPSIIEYG